MFTTSGPSDNKGSEADRTAPLLDVLGDDVAREILRLGNGQVMTVETLAEHCNVSEATVYRRLRQLHDLGLVEKCAQFEAGVVTQGAYRTTMDSLAIRMTENGLSVETGPQDELAEAVETVRNAIDIDAVNYDPKADTVQITIRLDGDDRLKACLGRYLK
ncbi:Helix-turn-helix domain-containing protein [Halogranum gelatinilyticum]|uniref:Helix-turn-helix domain-containing protein n=1 Tax=Halogranum gelatinilyticum TaxID=660521 RepID=A0A1G9UTX4_9EURY|nr:helix-turn-helix domain-containing protein [Halogranum gelatinilyticum]SDM63025.1 Helix-turn-helix domain-containing protein [Halogranum gelatinilyticum]